MFLWLEVELEEEIMLEAVGVLVASVAYALPIYESITVAATSIGFTAANINEGSGHRQMNKAICTLETGQIRFTIDGATTPTASVGQLLDIGSVLKLSNLDVPGVLLNFRAIRVSSTSGTLNCHYYE